MGCIVVTLSELKVKTSSNYYQLFNAINGTIKLLLITYATV